MYYSFTCSEKTLKCSRRPTNFIYIFLLFGSLITLLVKQKKSKGGPPLFEERQNHQRFYSSVFNSCETNSAFRILFLLRNKCPEKWQAGVEKGFVAFAVASVFL